MRKLILILWMMVFVFLYACSGAGGANHPYEGTFITENGVKFELRSDSTTLITFSNSITYEGVWSSYKGENEEYANIEFGGYPQYYYLKDGKVYRSKREMRHDAFGEKITYQD